MRGVEYYRQFVQERHAEFRARWDEFLHSLIGQNPGQKIAAAGSALQALENLEVGLPTSYRPSWIGILKKHLRKFKEREGHPETAKALLQATLALNDEVVTQRWDMVSESDGGGLDFERLFQEYYEESRVPELFEELLRGLSQIVDSGAVDSLRILRALEKVISTIRQNMRGSYWSTHGAWQFTRRVFENLLWEALESNTVLAVPVRAVRKALEELGDEMNKVDSSVGDAIASRAKEGIAIEPPMQVKGQLPPAIEPEVPVD